MYRSAAHLVRQHRFVSLYLCGLLSLRQVRKWLKKHPERKARDSGFLDFCRSRQADQQQQQGDVNGNTKVGETSGRLAKHSVLEVEWRGLDPRQRHK